MRTTTYGCIALLPVIITVAPSVARAESVDYGHLESLFGEPVTTSATGTPQRASEVSADMTIVTADEIRQSGSRSIPQILGMYVPGLNILQEGIDAFDVGIRGYQQAYQPRLLVLLDGRQVFLDDYSRTDWANLPINIDDIRQIEVVKGASSALFGSNATGGVINIITSSPIHDKSDIASVTIGTQRDLQEDATVTGPLGEGSGIKVSAGGMNEHEFTSARTPGDSNAGTVNPSHRYAIENSEFKVTDNLSVMTEASYSEKADQEAVFIDAIDPVNAAAWSLRAGFDWQTPIGMIQNNNYINHNYDDLNAGQRGDINVADQLIVSQLQDMFKIGPNNTFRAFVEFRNKQQTSEGFPFLVYEHPEFTSDTYATGGTWLWQINDKWSWTNAARVEHTDNQMDGTLEAATVYKASDYSQSYNTFAANSGLVFKMTEEDTLRALYGRGISDPSLVNSSFNIALVTGRNSVLDYEGNPYLKPTVVDNYGLSYEHKLPQMFSSVNLSGYFETNQDLIANVVGSPRVSHGIVYVLKSPENVGDSNGVGGEIGFKGGHNGFRWDASYSYQTVRDAALVLETIDYSTSAPESQFKLNFGYSKDKWEADVHGQFATSTDMLRYVKAIQEVGTSSYYSLGCRVGYNFNDNITLALSGTNVTLADTVESAYPAVEREALMTLTGKF